MYDKVYMPRPGRFLGMTYVLCRRTFWDDGLHWGEICEGAVPPPEKIFAQ